QGHFMLDVFARTSTDGGVTFSLPFQVNDPSNPFDPDVAKPGEAPVTRFPGPPPTTEIGEHFGIAASNGPAYVAWNGSHFDQQVPFNTRPSVQFDAFPIVHGDLTVTATNANDTVIVRNTAGNPNVVEVIVDNARQYSGLWSGL